MELASEGTVISSGSSDLTVGCASLLEGLAAMPSTSVEVTFVFLSFFFSFCFLILFFDLVVLVVFYIYMSYLLAFVNGTGLLNVNLVNVIYFHATIVSTWVFGTLFSLFLC